MVEGRQEVTFGTKGTVWDVRQTTYDSPDCHPKPQWPSAQEYFFHTEEETEGRRGFTSSTRRSTFADVQREAFF